MKDVIDERGVEDEKDEYHLHEMKIYNTFQDKINVHELEKWIAKLEWWQEYFNFVYRRKVISIIIEY